MKKLLLITFFPSFIFALNLKIATYNGQNLFDNIKNGSEYAEFTPNLHNWTDVILDKKLNNISRVICDLNADVIGLEEIENEHALKMLQKRLNRAGCKYPYGAITHKRGSAIQVALLSKVDLIHKRDIRVSNSSGDRDILEVELNIEPKLTIFVNHWRSKAAPESQRVKYAKALINRIKKMPKSKEYIILGDFNSAYNECENISIKNNDTNGVCGVDTILHTFNNGRIIKFRDKISLNSIYHYNLWFELPAHKRYSHGFYGKKSAIDSIMIPPNLADNKGWFYKKRSFKVFKKHYLFKRNMIFRWAYKSGKHLGVGYSDHLPIYAIFSNTSKPELKHESLIDKFFKLFISEDKNSTKSRFKLKLEEFTVDALAKVKYTKSTVVLKDACVIYKRGDFGVVKSSPESSAIALYKSAEGLEEGRCYDFKVYKKKRYFSLDEITDLDILRKKGKIDTNKFIKDFEPSFMQDDVQNIGDIVKNIRGVYKNRYIRVDNQKFKLYVKEKKRGLLRKNSHLYIKKAQIGYYKGEKELVVYSLEDISKEN